MPDPSPDRPPGYLRGSDAPARFSPRLPRARWLDWVGDSSRLIGLVLVGAGVLPPLGLAALPGGLSMLGAPRTGIVLVTTLLFAPALVGFTVALQGFDAVLARLRAENTGEYRQIISRVLLGALILGYLFGLLALVPDDPTIRLSLPIGSLNLAAAWLFLLIVVLDSRRSALRRYAALVSDVTLLSILIATGDGLTAPLALVYPYIAISNGEHHGPRALIATLAIEIVAFAAAAAATPFWRELPALAGGMLVAMVLLPAYAGAVLHRLGVAKTQAESANAAKNRFLSALSDDLRGPLRAIARAGTDIDPAALDPNHWDTIARTRLSARAMLLQLDDMLNYVKIDDGSFAPETRSFDLYRLANGAVAALRAPAAERGITLALRIDPQLPYQLRGWPHQLRQILICLMTNAVRQSDRAKVRVNLDAVELDTAHFGAERVTLRVLVTSSLADTRFEPDDDADRHLGLAVVDRLVALMGGRLAVDMDSRRGLALAVELPFAVDQASLALPLDLAHLPVLIVTRDAEFVGDLIEPLEAWRADPRWIGSGDAALNYIEAFDPGARRSVLIVDGRGDVLQALSWTHHAKELHAAEPPYVLFIADEPRIDSVIGLADGDLDGILPAPFTAHALRSALHALRVEPADWFLANPLPSASEDPPPVRRRLPEEVPASRPPVEEWRRSEPPEEPPIRIAPSSVRPRASTAATKPRRQVLVAAGNAANRKIIGSILSRAGHTVHFAENAEEAREGLEAREVDALLLDLTGQAGADYDAALECREARPNLPIIALTGDSPEIAERRARDAGIDAILPKPLEPRRLLAALASAFEPEPASTQQVGLASGAGGVVTELASHPRFAADPAPSADLHPAESRRSWSPEVGGLQAAIDVFRTDSARIVADIDRAAGSGDVQGFEKAILAMRACTEIFGVGRVREVLGSMRQPTPAQLRAHGANFVHRLESELARLDAALTDYLRAAK